MPDLYNISEWNRLTWFSTGGTRSKMYVQSPDGNYYFFKESEKREVKHYKYEFWSEIIAYEIGIQLKLNMLKYDIAIYKDIIGCISKSMHNPDEEELVEGGKYLQAINPEFLPEDKERRYLYSFQLIEKALSGTNLYNYIDNIIEIIIFDAIIGNGDRHQENWAFINKYTLLGRSIIEIEKSIKENNINSYSRLHRWVINLYKDKSKNDLKPEMKVVKSTFTTPHAFAPIYDSGSSLGRELSDEKVDSMLKNSLQLDAYINRGLAEIHWDGYNGKLKHFDLVSKLLKSSYHELVVSKINHFKSNFNADTLKSTLDFIDISVPEKFSHYKIPPNRKQLIITMVTLRLEKLIGLLK